MFLEKQKIGLGKLDKNPHTCGRKPDQARELTCVAVVVLGTRKKQLVLQPLMVELFLSHPVLIIIFAMTGRTQAKKDGVRIANIMIAVGCMKIHRIAISCSS